MSEAVVTSNGSAYVGLTQSLFGTFQFRVPAPLNFKDKITWEVSPGELNGSLATDSKTFSNINCYAHMYSTSEGNPVTEFFPFSGKYSEGKFSGRVTFPEKDKVTVVSSIDEYGVSCFVETFPTFAEKSASYTTPMEISVLKNKETTPTLGTSASNFELTFVTPASKKMTSKALGVPLFELEDGKKKGLRIKLEKLHVRTRNVKITMPDGFFHSPAMDVFPDGVPDNYNYDDGFTDKVSCDVRMNEIRHLVENVPMTRHEISVSLPQSYESQITSNLEIHCQEVGVTKKVPGYPAFVYVTSEGYDKDAAADTFIMASKIEMENSASFTTMAVSVGVLAASALAYFF